MVKDFLLPVCGLVAVFSLLSSCGESVEPASVKPIAISSDAGSSGERKMAALVRGHPKQRRKELRYDRRLTAAARARARDMGQRNYFNHTDPDGVGPNRYVTRTGYRLPIEWTAFKKANQVESIVAGVPTAEQAFQLLVNSRGHKGHVLATNPFYQNHTRYGVGHARAPASKYKDYWVLISAPIEE